MLRSFDVLTKADEQLSSKTNDAGRTEENQSTLQRTNARSDHRGRTELR